MLAAQPAAARLADWGPPKAVVARSALTNLLQVGRRRPPRPGMHLPCTCACWGIPPIPILARCARCHCQHADVLSSPQSNADLAPVFVDRSYAGDRRVAAGYFQARAVLRFGGSRAVWMWAEHADAGSAAAALLWCLTGTLSSAALPLPCPVLCRSAGPLRGVRPASPAAARARGRQPGAACHCGPGAGGARCGARPAAHAGKARLGPRVAIQVRRCVWRAAPGRAGRDEGATQERPDGAQGRAAPRCSPPAPRPMRAASRGRRCPPPLPCGPAAWTAQWWWAAWPTPMLATSYTCRPAWPRSTTASGAAAARTSAALLCGPPRHARVYASSTAQPHRSPRASVLRRRPCLQRRGGD